MKIILIAVLLLFLVIMGLVQGQVSSDLKGCLDQSAEESKQAAQQAQINKWSREKRCESLQENNNQLRLCYKAVDKKWTSLPPLLVRKVTAILSPAARNIEMVIEGSDPRIKEICSNDL